MLQFSEWAVAGAAFLVMCSSLVSCSGSDAPESTKWSGDTSPTSRSAAESWLGVTNVLQKAKENGTFPGR